MNRPLAILLGSLLLAAGAGAAVVAGTSSAADTPTRTVTVNVATGPSGPAGPAGPAGTEGCPSGYVPGVLVINHPTGHVKIFTCLEDTND